MNWLDSASGYGHDGIDVGIIVTDHFLTEITIYFFKILQEIWIFSLITMFIIISLI